MVKQLSLLLITILFLPIVAFAADFSARVDKNKVAVGQPLLLTLELSDSSAKAEPDLSALQKDFTVSSKQNSSNTTIINGAVSSTIGWNIRIVPKNEGQLIIPSISIISNQGILKTDPIRIEVTKLSDLPSKTSEDNLKITHSLSNNTPYKNEPFYYSVKITSQNQLSNVSITELSIKDTIVEQVEKPKAYRKIVAGVSNTIIESSYLITPLESGTITIPALLVNGSVAVNQAARSRFGNRNDAFGSFRDRFFGMDPFSASRFQEFTLASKQLNIEVKSPQNSILPWLPATSLEISQEMDPIQALKVGEPFALTLKIKASGITGEQLPDLESKLREEVNDQFKLYSDSSILNNDYSNNLIVSEKEQSFTVIPQKPGKFTLPSVQVTWWDVINEKAQNSKTPKREIIVQPNSAVSINENRTEEKPSELQREVTNSSKNLPKNTKEQSSQSVDTRSLYFIIFFLLAVIIFQLWLFIKQKNKQLTKSAQEADSNSKEQIKYFNFSASDISDLKTTKDIYEFLDTFSNRNLETPKNSSLNQIVTTLFQAQPELNQKELHYVQHELENALYADKSIEVEKIKDILVHELSKIEKQNNKKTQIDKDELQALNPS